MGKLILLRHGRSVWNQKNLFTGWIDIPLSKEGIAESVAAGKKFKHIAIDVIYTSTLVRAEMTALLAMGENDSDAIPCICHEETEPYGRRYQQGVEGRGLIPVYRASELNERMYGSLQGKNKDETRALCGEEQVIQWRRSFRGKPPEGESLAETAERAVPFFCNTILPEVQKGKTVLVSAHGNSLRAIVMYIEKMSEEEILRFEIATGELRIYDYQEGRLMLS